jgi:hypothetical protein
MVKEITKILESAKQEMNNTVIDLNEDDESI